MTPEQISSIRKSFQLMEGKEEVVTLLFYNRLFLKNPNMREMFPGDIKQQAQKLAEVLKLIYSSLEHLDSLRPSLRDLGSRHLREHGVLGKHYVAFCQTLIDTLRETAGTRFDDAAKQAWSSLLAQVSLEMQNGTHETVQLAKAAQ
jgi:hemoglobin-like flavoprotein